jgi:HAE1 family hydrophobic/amphiphilic exporter-1
LGEVARVVDSVEDDKQIATIYGQEFGKRGTPCMILALNRQPGSNTIQVIDEVRRLGPFFQKLVPPSVVLTVRGDKAQNIREAYQDIQFTMVATLALVIMVIFLFLRNIPAMALPFSIVGTFAVMFLLGFSLNHDGLDSQRGVRCG